MNGCERSSSVCDIPENPRGSLKGFVTILCVAKEAVKAVLDFRLIMHSCVSCWGDITIKTSLDVNTEMVNC